MQRGLVGEPINPFWQHKGPTLRDMLYNRLRTRLRPLLVLSLAATPPVLVVLDRWLSGAGSIQAALRPAWCSFDLLCRTYLPPYFLLVIPITLLIILLFIFERRPRNLGAFDPAQVDHSSFNEIMRPKPAPSRASRLLKAAAAIGYLLTASAALAFRQLALWAYLPIITAYFTGQILEGMHLDRVLAWIRKGLWKSALVVSAHVWLILLLAWHQSGRPAQWIAGALFAASIFGLIRIRRQIGYGVWIVLAAMVIFSARIGSWQLSVVGDEYRFFFDARAIITPLHPTSVIAHLFDGTWTYGTHPYVSSLIQALFMLFLGRDNFGWRFSNVFLAALSIGFFYLFFASLFSRRVSLVAALLLASSHYLMNFSKIGYNNLQALFVTGLVLWLAGVAVRSGRPLAYTALGVGASASFYVFPGALYVLPLPVILIWFCTPHHGAGTRRQAGFALAAFIILVFPLIIQPDFWEGKLAGLFVHRRDLVNSSTFLWFHFGSNLLYSLFSFLYIPHESHFVVSSHVDPLTAVFVPIGLALSIREAGRSKSALFLLLAFLLEAVLVGTTHDRPYPTSTRMFLMLPWLFLLAALAIDRGLETLARRTSGKRTIPIIAGSLMIAVLGLNIYQSTRVFRQRTVGTPGLEALFLRMLQHDAQEDPDTLKDYLFITAPNWGIDGLRLLQDVYKVPPSPNQLHRVVAESAELPEDALQLITQPDTVVIIQPWMDETLRLALEARLADMGRDRCEVRDTPQKDVRFSLWFAPNLEGLCERANADW